MSVNREDLRFWDVRTIDRRVRKGLITRKDIEKHLKSLDDVSNKGDLTRVDLEPGEGDDGEE